MSREAEYACGDGRTVDASARPDGSPLAKSCGDGADASSVGRQGEWEWLCLRQILDLLTASGLSLEDFLRGTASTLAGRWAQPRNVRVGIRYGDQEYGEGFVEAEAVHEAEIVVGGKTVGALRLGYPASGDRVGPDACAGGETKALAGLLGAVLGVRRAIDESRMEERHLVQLDKMAALGALISGVAHEINNPVNIAVLSTQNLVEAWRTLGPMLDQYHDAFGDFRVGYMPYSELSEQIPALMSGILDSLHRIERVVVELRDYVRQCPVQRTEAIDINLVVKSAVVLLTGVLRKSTQRFDVSYAEPLPSIQGDYQRLEQVVINLVDNACRALTGPGQAISVSTAYDDSLRSVVIAVRDGGVGIPAEHLHRITDPFFTTRRVQGASGLGLSVSLGIVASHGGRMDFVSSPGRGTTVRVLLPVDLS